jgi:hypothetical protein
MFFGSVMNKWEKLFNINFGLTNTHTDTQCYFSTKNKIESGTQSDKKFGRRGGLSYTKASRKGFRNSVPV